MFDEYFSFGADQNKGEARALKEFLALHPEFVIRDFASYGAGGKIFVVDLSR